VTGTRFTKNNPLTTAGGIQLAFRAPVLLCTVKTHASRDRRAFARFCSLRGLTYKIPHDVTIGEAWGFQTVIEVSGPGPALEELSVQHFVVKWEVPLDVGAPRMNSSVFRRSPY
jgi:hypothetical protein